MLSDFEGALAILENAKRYLVSGNIELAHSSFKNMQRCRVNFFSKYLYFLGRSMGIKHYPLIFDARVAKSIGYLTSTNPSFFSILDIQPKQDPTSYSNYVAEIHEIANQINVEGEKIEYFLFNGLE
jgi:hypothetical protein